MDLKDRMSEEEILKSEKIFNEFKNEKLSEDDYNKAQAKAAYLGTLAGEFYTLLKMIKYYWDGKFEISKSNLSIIIGTILYVVSPIDAILDAIPFFGYVDDAAILTLSLKNLTVLINNFKNQFGE